MVKRVVAARELKPGHVLTESDIGFRIPTDAKITPNALRRSGGSLVGKTHEVPVLADEIIGFEEYPRRRRYRLSPMAPCSTLPGGSSS